MKEPRRCSERPDVRQVCRKMRRSSCHTDDYLASSKHMKIVLTGFGAISSYDEEDATLPMRGTETLIERSIAHSAVVQDGATTVPLKIGELEDHEHPPANRTSARAGKSYTDLGKLRRSSKIDTISPSRSITAARSLPSSSLPMRFVSKREPGRLPANSSPSLDASVMLIRPVMADSRIGYCRIVSRETGYRLQYHSPCRRRYCR